MSIPRVYPVPPFTFTASNCWWNRFHDPQLNQLISIALADSPDMQKAANRVRKANELANYAKSALFPFIDASGYLTRERFSETGIVPPPFNGRTFNIADLALNFNYEFDFWGKNSEALAARVNAACASKANYAYTRLILSTAVAETYFQLQSAIAQQKIALATLKQRQEMYAITKSLAGHEIESDIPVKVSLTDVQNAKLTVNQYKLLEKLLRNRLALLMGKNPLSTTIEVRPFAYHKNAIRFPTYIPANQLTMRPDVAAACLRAKAAAHQINVAKARFFPNINLLGFLSYQSIQTGHLFDPENQNNAITGAFDLPIFDAGARRANLGVRYAEYDFAVNVYNKTLLNALKDVADQAANLKTLNAQLAVQNTALQAAARNYKMMRARYNNGIVDYLPVLQIKGALLQQQAEQIDYQTRHLRSVVAMIKALGGDYLITERQNGSYTNSGHRNRQS